MALGTTNKESIVKRLRRIEGQVKGIERMVEDEKDCKDILVQVSAVRAAMNSVGGLILENYMKDCLGKYLDGESEDQSLDSLINIMIQYTKQN